MKRKIFSILLMLPLMCFGLIGCSGDTAPINNAKVTENKTVNLMSNVKASNISVDITPSVEDNKEAKNSVSNFAMEIFKENLTDENTMISPISIINALAMTSNGAVGPTLTQMENVIGEDIGEYLKNYNAYIEASEVNKVNLANSIWFRDSQRLEVKNDFLQKNKDSFDADIFSAQFDDETLVDINNWVSENTSGMIESIIDDIPNSAIMYLINAISFDAEWEEIYKETNIHELEFFNADGTVSKVEFMTSEEQKVIELDNAVGFIKPYKNNEFSFVGILPNKNSSIEDVVTELTNVNIQDMLANYTTEEVDVILPKFNLEYSVELSDVLVNMGIKDAFDSGNANFSNMAMGDGNIFIGNVIHKTYINVDEKGTQAGAATAVEMLMKMSMPMPKREIRLDQPFMYMIVDNRDGNPLFIGNINFL